MRLKATKGGTAGAMLAGVLAGALALAGLVGMGVAQTSAGTAARQPTAETLSRSPRAWADDATAQQIRFLDAGDAVPLRYRVHKVDAKGDTTRELIESRDGTVARLIERNGAPLSADENAAERERLQSILQAPEEFVRRRQREHADRGYARQVMESLPRSMRWSYAPGQPQLPPRPGAPPAMAVVLDFVPDPNFKPPSLVTEGLTGLAGRVWINAQTHCMERIEGRVLHPVDFGWGGMLARVNAGGTVAFEQAAVGEHRWLYTTLSSHLVIREVLVHTVHEDTEARVGDVHVLPGQVSLQEAIGMLLALPVPTR